MKKRLQKVICVYVLLFVLLVGYYFVNKYTGFIIVCPIHYVTGYLCPGCGITRCLFSILEFHFGEAFYYHPLVFILLPFFLVYFLYNSIDYVLDRKKPMKIPNYIIVSLLVVVIIFGIVRNITF